MKSKPSEHLRTFYSCGSLSLEYKYEVSSKKKEIYVLSNTPLFLSREFVPCISRLQFMLSLYLKLIEVQPDLTDVGGGPADGHLAGGGGGVARPGEVGVVDPHCALTTN